MVLTGAFDFFIDEYAISRIEMTAVPSRREFSCPDRKKCVFLSNSVKQVALVCSCRDRQV